MLSKFLFGQSSPEHCRIHNKNHCMVSNNQHLDVECCFWPLSCQCRPVLKLDPLPVPGGMWLCSKLTASWTQQEFCAAGKHNKIHWNCLLLLDLCVFNSNYRVNFIPYTCKSSHIRETGSVLNI